ncbi:GreA/GreB family elongation factor [Sphingomonas sp.]|uniref:GreA/GreB family elongation factor n=1 Tax=Sphingomonas sp. TaxID=28214 RepID=UPI00286B01A4|nr:GreA/GreB family elongation factor [Sphingomonas sp.]
MSVAFRRECDEEHLEPKFELPVPPGPNLVTERGYGMIQARNAELEAAYAAEKNEESRKALLRDLRYWRQRLASAQVAPLPSGQTVAFGTQVTFERDGERSVLAIVGHDESDPAHQRVAFTAPLARALIGAEVGDEVELAGAASLLTVVAIKRLAD